jgi:hypothetical protein
LDNGEHAARVNETARSSRGIWITAGFVILAALGLGWVATLGDERAETSEPPNLGPVAVSEASSREEPAAGHPAKMPERIRWIGVGGGAEPELNQLSLEEDLLLVREIFGNEGVVLFAGGPGTRSVQVADSTERGDPLVRELAGFLSGRGERSTRYQPTRLDVHGPATLDRTVSVISSALEQTTSPLLLWIATHGDRGERPADSRALLWAGTELDVMSLYDVMMAHREPRRPIRLVVTSCYAGGFAELAFEQAEPKHGPTSLDICGFFATSWDEEASGCDPHPDRAEHEAWSIHFLEALRGRDRQGHDQRAVIDLDHDGVITFGEANAYARVVALSFDLPTTMSARLLRELAPREGPRVEVSLPEEEAVVSGIGQRLDVSSEADVQARLDALATRSVELEAAFEERHAEAEELWWTLVGEMLSRWPVIDDPWHPDFQATLEREGRAIRAFLTQSDVRARWLDAQEDLHAMEASLASLEVQAAPLRRWLEAHETIYLAGQLRALGGEPWARYERMRACENGVP